MNSQLEIRDSFVGTLAGIIDKYNTDNSANVGFTVDNDTAFDPSGFEQWVMGSLIIGQNSPLAKDRLVDEDLGIYQASVFVSNQSEQMDRTQLKLIDTIKLGFRKASLGKISIDSQQANAGRKDDAWFVRDLSINYYVLS